MTTNGDAMGEPIAVVFRRRVRAGREADYERWLEGLQREARTLSGYLGVEVVRPGPGGREYTSVVRFASLDALESFERSEVRRAWIERLPADVVEGEADVRRLEGMEAWFTASGVAAPVAPTRWKMSLVLVFVVYGLILGIGPVIGAIVGDVAYPVRLLLTVIVEVALMTWVVMPTVTRVLGRWLFAK